MWNISLDSKEKPKGLLIIPFACKNDIAASIAIWIKFK